MCLVVSHPLEIEVIGVLIHCNIDPPHRAVQVHVNLHLIKVLRLSKTQTLLDQFLIGLGIVSFELRHVPLIGRLPQSDHKRIKAAPEVPSLVAHAKLPPSLRIHIKYCGPCPAKVRHEPSLL